MNKFSLLFVLFIQLAFSQPLRRDNDFIPGMNDGLFISSIQIIPSGSANTAYYTYRIPYNRLVFEKIGDKYTAEYSISIEVFDTKNNFIVRSFSGKKIDADDFEQTNLQDLYVEGVNEFELGNGEFNIIPFYNDIKSGREIKLKPLTIVTSTLLESKILQPIVVDAEKFACDGGDYITLTNFEGNIPFTENKYNLIIPVSDSTISKLYVSILSGTDTVYNGVTGESFFSTIRFQACNGRVVVSENSSSEMTRNFIVSNFSSKLNPGNLIINISKSENSKEGKTFQKSLVWYNKPSSLNDPEFAIRILKLVAEESAIKELLKQKEEEYDEVLFDYWKKYDPTPETAFNQLMSEFYHRVDYAASSFRPIAGKSGIDTDRGKILVKFGRPKKIERTSNEYGKVVETWVYENPQRKFIFVDQRGTGDFSLTKG